MAYRVTAAYVSVETEIKKGSRAVVDFPRGETLPDDVPQEQIDTLLRREQIEEVKQRAKSKASSEDK